MADILAPMTPEEFFAEYHGRKELHIPGAADKFASVVSWDILNRVLNDSYMWPHMAFQLMIEDEPVPPEDYALYMSPGGEMLLDRRKVLTHLRNGASIVLNAAESLAPGLATVARALESALGAKIQGNLYCTWRANQAFDSHFDCHDVYALHVEGEKTWNVYEGRIELPIEHSAFKSFGRAYHDEAKGAVKAQYHMTPGDLLYLPRGTYHDALSDSAGALHIAFGVHALNGIDYLNQIYDSVVLDPLFRADVPLAAKDVEAFHTHLGQLASRLGEIAGSGNVVDSFGAYQNRFANARGGFDLPRDTVGPGVYRVTAPDFKVAERDGIWVLTGAGGTVPIPAGRETPVAWIIAQESFTLDEFRLNIKDLNSEDGMALLADLARMGVIATTAEG
jgi:hypothetical protein